MDDSTSKEFFTPKTSFLYSLLTLPVGRIQFLLEKYSVQGYLSKQHGITSSKEAFTRSEHSHKVLSDFLGSKPFFFSTNNRQDRPTSADIIVYSYLSYEIQLLSKHPHFLNSLANYSNLLEFVQRIESTIRLKQKAGLSTLNFEFSMEKIETEEFFSSKVYENPMEIGNDHWNQITYKLGGDEPLLRYSPTYNNKRRAIITGITTALFVIFYFRKQSS